MAQCKDVADSQVSHLLVSLVPSWLLQGFLGAWQHQLWGQAAMVHLTN